MDRLHPSAAHRATAVRTAGSAALDLLLSTAAGERGEPAPDVPTRPVVHEAPVFRQPENGRRTGNQSQTCATTDADSGHRSALSQTQLEPSGTGSRSVPVPAARCRHRKSKSRLEHRYYVHSDAGRLSLPGRGDGLVQPLRAELGTVQHDGDRLLPSRASRRVSLRPTRNLELRSGLAIYLPRFSGSAEEAWDLHQYGWPRSRTRQRFHRTSVALAQIRTDLPRRLRHRPGLVPGVGNVLSLLQLPTAPSGAGLSDAGGLVPAQSKKEVASLNGGAAPKPLGFSAVVFQNGCFCF